MPTSSLPRPWTMTLIAVFALVMTLTAAPASAKHKKGCENPDDLPIVHVGSEMFTTAAPDLPVDSSPVTFDVIVDLESQAPAGLVEAEIDWATPAEHHRIRLINARGDATINRASSASTLGTSTAERTRNIAAGLVADCERLTVEVDQYYGGPPQPLSVEVRLTPHDAAPAREVHVGPGDATVVAVIVDAFNPYHLEFRADGMPGRDLPLDTAPHRWLPGFPNPSEAFAEYRPLDLTLPADPDAIVAEARAADDAVWTSTSQSEPNAINYHWVPGSKFIGAVDFTGNWQTDDHLDPVTGRPNHDLNALGGSTGTSISAANSYGTCPECVYVTVVADQQDVDRVDMALHWASAQSWIDVVIDFATPSGEEHNASTGGFFWKYSNSRVDVTASASLSRDAHARGQQHFMSGYQGTANTENVPGQTYLGHTGMDWITTVTGVTAEGAVRSGNVRGADIAAVEFELRVTDGATVNGSRNTGFNGGQFLVGGLYARSLLLARQAIPGPSRAQADGVVAAGGGGRCTAIADCPLADGRLTRAELVDHLHAAAELIDVEQVRANPRVPVPLPRTPFDRDNAIATLGHGVLRARDFGDVAWHDSIDRIVAPVLGERRAAPIAADVIAHQTADSYCRQQRWGDWDEGYFVRGGTDLPGPDAERPQRNALVAACTAIVAPVGAQ